MVRKLPESRGNAIGYEVSGKLTEEEYEAVIEELEEAIEQYGSIQLLVSLPEMPRPELEAIDEDWEFTTQHMNDIERYAVVSDSRLMEWTTKLTAPLVNTDTKHFDRTEYEQAWQWLRA